MPTHPVSYEKELLIVIEDEGVLIYLTVRPSYRKPLAFYSHSALHINALQTQ